MPVLTRAPRFRQLGRHSNKADSGIDQIVNRMCANSSTSNYN